MISVNQLLNILSEKVCVYRDAYTDVRKKDNVLIPKLNIACLFNMYTFC